MAVNNNFFEEETAIPLKTDLEGLNGIYKDIADEIGLENALAIFRMFHGTQVSFPGRLFSKEHIHRAIIREYDGKNVPQLAQKYNYSERSIWRILKTNKGFSGEGEEHGED